MKLIHAAIALCFAQSLSVSLSAQIASTPRHTGATTHHAATSAAGNPADHPPGVPPVRGLPKPLYSLRYIDILVGSGDLAAPQKFYTVRYTGWTTDGKKFDSSDDHPGKEPITFPYGAHRVIIGWTPASKACASAANAGSLCHTSWRMVSWAGRRSSPPKPT